MYEQVQTMLNLAVETVEIPWNLYLEKKRCALGPKTSLSQMTETEYENVTSILQNIILGKSSLIIQVMLNV